MEYPQSHSRWLIFVKLLLALPHFIVVYLLFIPLSILTLLAWFAILFTGRYPRAFFDFNTGILRWTANVGSYVFLLRDGYPPFSWEAGEYPLILDIPYPERQSRFRLFIRFFAVIPNQFVLAIVQLGWYLTTFIAWWAILFTGHFPKGLFRFSVGVGRWYFRQSAYLYLLRDEYSPYSVNADARPGNELVSAALGFPIFAAYVALYATQFSLLFSGDDTTTTRLDAAVISRTQPSVSGGGLELTLLDYEGSTYVHEFEVRAEKDGFLPTFFVPVFFTLEPSFDGAEGGYGVDDVGGTNFSMFWTGGEETVRVRFVTDGATICDLKYFTFGGPLTFRFR